VDAEGEDEDQEDEQEEEGQGEGEGTAKKAWVLAVYIDAEGTEWKFQRT
jgi:structural maintenance of chromosome 1